MKTVDFDIEKDPLGQAVPLRIVRAREDWPYGSSRADKINRTCTTKQQDPDVVIQIPASAHAQPICCNRSISHRAIRLL